jgi:hypothetical protein
MSRRPLSSATGADLDEMEAFLIAFGVELAGGCV